MNLLQGCSDWLCCLVTVCFGVIIIAVTGWIAAAARSENNDQEKKDS